jgi:hypothetical protein
MAHVVCMVFMKQSESRLILGVGKAITEHLLRHVHKIAKSDYQLYHVCPSSWNSSASTAQIFMKLDIYGFFKIMSRKSDKNNRYFA